MGSPDVLVIGQSGQVASALARLKAETGLTYRFCSRPQADLTKPGTLRAAIMETQPRLVLNAAAYTAVDKAETEAELASAVNAEGPAHLAAICRDRGIALVQLSTDYVFDGTRRTPYAVDDSVSPLGIYGKSKAAGEAAVRAALDTHLILRLSWVFSEAGRNFVTTMLRLATERRELRVVDDQIGAPTYAGDIAWALDRICGQVLRDDSARPWGTYHLTNAGQTSWYGFASEIFARASRFGHPKPAVTPIPSSDYPTPARRPLYSVLDTSLTSRRFGVALPPWQHGLERCLRGIFAGSLARVEGSAP